MNRFFGFLLVIILAVLIVARMRSTGPAPAPPSRASATGAVSPPASPVPPMRPRFGPLPPGQSRQQQYSAEPHRKTIEQACKDHNLEVIELKITETNIVELTIRGRSRQEMAALLDDLLDEKRILKDLFADQARYWQAIEQGGMVYYAYYKMRIF